MDAIKTNSMNILLIIAITWVVIFAINVFLWRQDLKSAVDDLSWFLNEKVVAGFYMIILLVGAPYFLVRKIHLIILERIVIWQCKRVLTKVMKKHDPNFSLKKELKKIKDEQEK